MKTTAQWFDAVKAAQGWDSDYELCRALGIDSGTMSNYRSGKRAMDAYMAMRLAELLNADPLKMIASAEAERAKTPERKRFWQRIAACVVIGAGLNVALPSPPAQADPGAGVYYVKSGRQRKQRLGSAALKASDYVKQAGSAFLQMASILALQVPRRLA